MFTAVSLERYSFAMLPHEATEGASDRSCGPEGEDWRGDKAK